jgi:predicted RNA binding protein YcfA (HicA-like mRNA interferase family)
METTKEDVHMYRKAIPVRRLSPTFVKLSTSISKIAAWRVIGCPRKILSIRRAKNRHSLMKLPTDFSGQELRRALERIGFVYQRQKGSHMILRRDDPHSRVVVSDHWVEKHAA